MSVVIIYKRDNVIGLILVRNLTDHVKEKVSNHGTDSIPTRSGSLETDEDGSLFQKVSGHTRQGLTTRSLGFHSIREPGQKT